MPRHKSIALIVLLALAILFVVSLSTGPVFIGFGEVILSVFGQSKGSGTAELIVNEIRLPRTILAILIGAGLGMSGAALQAITQNALAEPGVIGISSLSALGAVIVFYTGFSQLHPLLLPVGGFAGALLCTVILMYLAFRGVSTLTLILAGVAINSLAGALTALALNLSPNPFAAYEIIFWLLGSLANRSIDHVHLVLPFMFLGGLLLLYIARNLDVFVLGEDVAATLGVNIRTVQVLTIIATALVVGTGVAVAGVIGFVGLVVPHLLRPFVGSRPSRLIPLSALGGAMLTLAADIVCRLASIYGLGNGELKLGVLTALLGAPFFLFLVINQRRIT